MHNQDEPNGIVYSNSVLIFNLKSDLGMLMDSILMLSTTFLVKLKMESLSGLTDLVVSMTNMRGGLSTLPCDLVPAPSPGPDCGHRAH